LARIRTIKPEAGTNERLGKMPPIIRWFFALLPCHADKKGRLKDRPNELGFKIIPYDMPKADPDQILSRLAESEFIVRYKAADDKLIQIMGFQKHQKPNL